MLQVIQEGKFYPEKKWIVLFLSLFVKPWRETVMLLGISPLSMKLVTSKRTSRCLQLDLLRPPQLDILHRRHQLYLELLNLYLHLLRCVVDAQKDQ